MTGRPSTYNEQTTLRICERLIEGESLRSICRDPEMPSTATVCKWLGQFPAFAELYARAREAQADTLADEILDIADDSSNDFMQRKRRDGSVDTVVNDEAMQRSKLRVDARKWLAAKMKPRKYGDVTKLEHSGPDGAPIAVDNTVGLATAAVRELRKLRMTSGTLPDADAPESRSGEDLL